MSKRITLFLNEEKDKDLISLFDNLEKKKSTVVKRALRYYLINSINDFRDVDLKNYFFNNITGKEIDSILVNIINDKTTDSEISPDMINDLILDTQIHKSKSKKKESIKKENQDQESDHSQEHIESSQTDEADILHYKEDVSVKDASTVSEENEAWINESIGSLLANLQNQ